MARAEIYIEDDEDGMISLAVRYIGGEPQVTSGAHQLANACRRFLESNLQQVTEPVITDANGNPVASDPAPVQDSAAPDEGAAAVH
jgi:hypothetical protein